jgi:hypothetical protein
MFTVNYNTMAMRPAAAATPHPIVSTTATALGPMFGLTVEVAVALRLAPDCGVFVVPRLVIEIELVILDDKGVCEVYGVVGTALQRLMKA